MSDTQFTQMELDPRILQALGAMDFDLATPIQAQVIPLIRSGADVIATSQTGTGKTAAFTIPALEAIEADSKKPFVQVLVLCPTRELAQQAGEQIRLMSKFMPNIAVAEVFGGASMERQFIQLRRANLVVGTPGRVMDHMRRGTIKLDMLKMVVLDEADEMLNMGFKEDIETILTDTPPERQIVLFSATMPSAIRRLAQTFQRDPQTVAINKSQMTIAQIDQSCVEAPISRKMEALNLLLRLHKPKRALIFCNTKRMVDDLGEYLSSQGFSAESIHGDLKQMQRTRVMNDFKRGRTSILIATDVASRGIDVTDLDYVFNYDIPMNAEYYIHRIGRTGRAGKSGASITLFSGKRQRMTLQQLSRIVKAEIRQDDLPTQAQIRAKEQERMLETVAEAIENAAGEDYAGLVEALVARDYAPERIAAALLSLHFPQEELPAEILAHSNRELRRERSSVKTGRIVFTDMIVDVGAANHIEPKHLVGAITERSGITGQQVGKIQIFGDHSIVGVPVDEVDNILSAMHDCKICGKQAHMARLADGSKSKSRPLSKASPAKQYSSRVAAKYNAARTGGPKRKNLKIPDFEG